MPSAPLGVGRRSEDSVTALPSYSLESAPRLRAVVPSSDPAVFAGSGAWPLLTARRQGFLSSVLGGMTDPSRVRRMPGDLLIGLPLSLVGVAVGRLERFRSSADVD